MRPRGFESRPVLSIFDNLIQTKCTHDVAAACCLAMAEVRVRLPLGALMKAYRKVWKSACFGSRRSSVQIRLRLLPCGGACVGTGGRLLSVFSQVRFLPPQLLHPEGQANGRWQLSRKQPSDEPCEFNSHPFRLSVLLAERLIGASLPSWTGGFNSRRALSTCCQSQSLGDRLAVGCLTLNQETEVRTLLPELAQTEMRGWQTHSGAVAVGSDAWL